MYIKRGDSFFPTNEANTDIRPTLPPGNYTIKMAPTNELYFEAMSPFTLPSRIYGDVEAKAERILATFLDRPNSTGTLLTGEKGSGKSMLAKLLAVKACTNLNIPVIVVNCPWTGDAFNKLIQDLPAALVLFDEFEKVYSDRNDQKQILTLMDGVFPSKKLFVMTCNDKYSMDTHLHNRPGRIYYMIDYHGLELDFIQEYCEDKLKNKTRIQDILRASSLFEAFNFDMLQALVEEMNRYDESPYEALKMLNIRPSAKDGSYTVHLTVDGVVIPSVDLDDAMIYGNPLARDEIYISYTDRSGEEARYTTVHVTRNELTEHDVNLGKYTFNDGEGNILTLTKRTLASADHYKFLDF